MVEDKLMMDYRNPVFNSAGGIDCEINHPQFGWIPFTASPDDSEKHGRDLFAAISAVGNIAPYVPVPPTPPSQEEQEANRQYAYTQEADPLFFKWQAGEGTEQEWLAKREEIRSRYPYSEE